jgi:hypothetical protein
MVTPERFMFSPSNLNGKLFQIADIVTLFTIT